MRAMLPAPRKTLKRLRRALADLRVLGRPLAWGLGLWAAAVGVPYAFLWPEAGLDQSACLMLAALAPVSLVLAAATGEATAVLAAGLLGLVPVLVACPELQGPRTTGPLPALLVGVLTLGFVGSAWRHTGREQSAPLHRLWTSPRGLAERLQWALGGMWLLLAWRVVTVEAEASEGARAARVAGVAVCWLAVRLLPLQGPVPRPDAGPDRWPLYVGRRVAWLLLCGGLLWLWRRGS